MNFFFESAYSLCIYNFSLTFFFWGTLFSRKLYLKNFNIKNKEFNSLTVCLCFRLPEFELVPLKDGRNRRRALIPENKDCYKDDDLGEESEEEEGEKSEDEEGEESEDDEGEDSEDEEGVESEDEEDANQSENEEDEDLTEGRYEEKEDLQSSSDDEDSDVDNIVPRNKMVEPPAKKRKTGVSFFLYIYQLCAVLICFFFIQKMTTWIFRTLERIL